MEKITLNGKRYIALGEFNHLRHNLVRDIYDRYERDENGQIHLSPEDVGMVTAYTHIMIEIMKDELEAAHLVADSPETLKANHDKVYEDVRNEYIEGRYLIVGKDGDGEIYFRKMCPYVPKDDGDDDGESTPVFTNMKRLAASWTDHYQATNFCSYLKNCTKMDELRVVPAWQVYMTAEQAKRLFDSIFHHDGQDGDGE